MKMEVVVVGNSESLFFCWMTRGEGQSSSLKNFVSFSGKIWKDKMHDKREIVKGCLLESKREWKMEKAADMNLFLCRRLKLK